jgi:hypothetical protein
VSGLDDILGGLTRLQRRRRRLGALERDLEAAFDKLARASK